MWVRDPSSRGVCASTMRDGVHGMCDGWFDAEKLPAAVYVLFGSHQSSSPEGTPFRRRGGKEETTGTGYDEGANCTVGGASGPQGREGRFMSPT